MKKHTGWKKTAAFLLAFTLAAAPLSQTGAKGGLFGGTGIRAYAGSDIYGENIDIFDNDSGTLSSDMTCEQFSVSDNSTLTINKGVTLTLNINDIFQFYGSSKMEVHGKLAGTVSGDVNDWWDYSYINVYLSDGAKYTVTGLSCSDGDDYLCYYGYDAATDGNGTVSVKNGDTAVTSESIGYKTTTYTYTATPASGYKFKNWTKGAGGEVIGTDASIDVTCEQNGQYQVYANFEEAVVQTDISAATVNLKADNSVESIKIGDNEPITDLTGFDITYGTDTNHTATTVPTESGTYYAFVTAKNNNETYGGTAKSAEFTVAAPEISEANIILNDGFTFNFYIDNITETTGYTVKFDGKCDKDGQKVAVVQDDDGRFVATTNVYAKNVNRKITAQLYKGDEPVGEPVETSVAEYLKNVEDIYTNALGDATATDEEKATYKKWIAIAKATQLYADASDAYFNSTGNVTNDSVAAQIAAYMTTLNINDEAIKAALNKDYKLNNDNVKVALVLDSKMAVRVYVKGVAVGTAGEINGKAVTSQGGGSNADADYPSYFEVTGITPVNIDEFYTLSVGGNDYKFSALTWCQRVMNASSAPTEDVNIAKTVYAYYLAAVELTKPVVVAENKETLTFSGGHGNYTYSGTHFSATGQTDFEESFFHVFKLKDFSITALDNKTITKVEINWEWSANKNSMTLSSGSFDGNKTINDVNATSLRIGSTSAAGFNINGVTIWYE